jgi:hypothetical protein
LIHYHLTQYNTRNDVIAFVDTIESFYDAATYSYNVSEGRTTADTPKEYEKLCCFFGWIPAATITALSSVRLVGHDTLVPTLFVNTSSLAFPLSIITNAMNLLQLIPFSWTHQPLTMVLHARRSCSSAPRAWSPMPSYGIKSDGKFVATLEDNIQKRGAMSKLISDSLISRMPWYGAMWPKSR